MITQMQRGSSEKTEVQDKTQSGVITMVFVATTPILLPVMDKS
jgi:hypothetical protein